MTRHFLGWFLWTLLLSAARAGLAATIIVTTNSDEVSLDGACSLREAIEAANTNLSVSECVAGDPGLDAIGFAIPGAGVRTLSPQSALPAFSEPVMLDGYTQPGASANTLEVGNDNVLLIELDGAGAGAASGLTFLAGASGSAVRGLVINGFGSPQAQAVSGIFLDGADNVTIQGNFIGTDPDGLLAAGNWWGITLESSDANLIGGALPAERNVVSGNFNTGIRIRTSSTDNLVLGNYIGVDRTGAAPLENRTQGLRTDGSFGTVIGGLDSGEANVISNNGRSGIRLSSSTALVQGNYIGTDASGSVALGNGEEGVGVFGSGGSHITRNTIFGNGGLGIDLDADGSGVADGVTPNDLGDGDSGGNGLQNFPVLSSALASDGMTSVEGSLNSLQDSVFTVELFANPICDVSAHGEGQVFLGAFELATNVDGNADFSVDMPIVAVGSAITATATNDSDQTSEFSSCVTAVSEPIDTLDQAFGDFAFGQGGGPVWGQSFEAFSDHIGSVTLLAAGTPGNFFLLVTAARVDVLAPGGVSPDFNDIRFTSSLIELPNVGPDFQEISLDVDADMIIGEKIFIVADMFSEGASGRIGFQAANALTNDAIPSGDLLWIIEENVPQNATELTDLNVDGAFTALFSDIAIRIAVPEPTALQMQMVALLAVFVLVATRQRRLDRALCVLKIRPPCSGTGSLGPTCQND